MSLEVFHEQVNPKIRLFKIVLSLVRLGIVSIQQGNTFLNNFRYLNKIPVWKSNRHLPATDSRSSAPIHVYHRF